MSLPVTLNTNEVKNSAGTELEFTRRSTGPGSALEFAYSAEVPSLPYRLLINHQEIGSGVKRVRRSRVGFNRTLISTVDSVTPAMIQCYTVCVVPVGHLAASTEVANVIANQMSFLASLGASTTILYDCTGNGASTLLNGSL